MLFRSGGFIISDELNKACTTLMEGGTGSLSHEIHQPTFMPDKFECGTLNMPGIVGLSNAIDFINEIGINNIKEKNSKLYKRLLNGILNIDGFEVYGDVTGSRSTTSLSFNLKGMDPSELSFLLESNGVSNRSGLQCAPMCHEIGRAHV